MKKYIWLAVVVLVAIVVGLISYRLFVFQIVSTTPVNGGELLNGSNAKVTIETNKQLDDTNTNLYISGSEDIFEAYSLEGPKIIVTVKNLELGKSYKLYVQNIKAKDGSVIKNFTLTFKNSYSDFAKLSKKEQEQSIADTDKNNVEDPALEVLPITTDAFYASTESYEVPDEKGKRFKIIIALLIPNPDLYDKQLIKDYKQRALNFFASKNINLNDYVVEWEPAEAKDL